MTSRRGNDSKQGRKRSGLDPILLLILLAALALRLWGVADRLPDPRVADLPRDDTAVDEGDRRAMLYGWQMWYGGTHALQLNPGTGDWPGLPFYLTLGSQVAYRGYDALLHPGSSANSFAKRVEEHPGGMFLAARLVSVALGVLSVFLLYRLGLLLGGIGVARFAAGFLAVMPFHVFSSQRISDPNLLSLVFMTAASIGMIRLVESGALKASILTGVWIGLAGASKYLPLVLVVPFFFAHAGITTGERGPRPWLRWKALAAGLAAALLSFALTSPFTFLDWKSKLKDMKAQESRHMAEWAGISTHARALPTYLVQTIPDLLTWVGYVLAIAGCVLLWRKGKSGRVQVLIPLLFIAGVGTLGLAQPRFVFPALGILVVACALSVETLANAIAAHLSPAGRDAGRTARTISLLALAGFAVWGVAAAAATQRALSKPDSRYVAHDWVVRSIDPEEMMALDPYGPVLKTGAEGRLALPWPFYTTRTEYVRAAFRPEWLDGIHFYVMSSEVTRRFEGTDERYRSERDFYGWIRRRGVKVWGTDTAATFGPRIDVYRLPPNISPLATRDSLWAEEMAAARPGGRIARWISDMAQDFLLAGDHARAEEWGRRGYALRSPASHQSVTETYAMALLQSGKAAESEAISREGARLYPRAALLHLFRAMALEALNRPADALEEYRLALPLSHGERARAYVKAAIERLGKAG